MKFLSTTRPVLIVLVIRDDTAILIKLIQILTSLGMFLWLHKDTFLELAENINSLFQTLKEIRLFLRYRYSLLLNPFPYCP